MPIPYQLIFSISMIHFEVLSYSNSSIDSALSNLLLSNLHEKRGA